MNRKEIEKIKTMQRVLRSAYLPMMLDIERLIDNNYPTENIVRIIKEKYWAISDDDVIRRSDAIDAVYTEVRDDHNPPTAKESAINGALVCAAGNIESLPTAKAQAKQIAEIHLDIEEVVKRVKEKYYIWEWIPTSEHLPELNDDGASDMILLCWSDGQVVVGTYAGDRTFVGQGWPKATGATVKVVAWMPIPEPYVGGEDE